MTCRIGLATTIAAVAILTQGLLALAPAATQTNSVSVSVIGGNTLQVVGDDTDNTIHESRETDPACPGGSPCDAVWSEGTVLTPSVPGTLPRERNNWTPGVRPRWRRPVLR